MKKAYCPSTRLATHLRARRAAQDTRAGFVWRSCKRTSGHQTRARRPTECWKPDSGYSFKRKPKLPGTYEIVRTLHEEMAMTIKLPKR